MTTLLYVDQLEQELIDIRKKNRQLVREVRNMQQENLQLCKQISEDRKRLIEEGRVYSLGQGEWRSSL